MSSTFFSRNDASSENKPLSAQPKTNASYVARVCSDILFQGASVLELEHNGQIYRLQKTALNKLILTK